MFPILQGIVGSTAYGLAGPDSDVDRLGIFAHPTEKLWGLDKLDETKASTKPDMTMHEAAKYCRLALSGNPTVMELMWLPQPLLTGYGPMAVKLLRIRHHFLSAPRVRDAYLGYATRQFRKLEARGDGAFSSDLRKRTAKHARHLLRLLSQGSMLYLTGHLDVKVSNPAGYHEFGNDVAAGNIERARDILRATEDLFNENTSPLPDKPNREPVEAWLQEVRRTYLDRPAWTE